MAALIKGLTPRENQIMELMTSGKSSKQIAFDLKISSNTVDIHRSKVMKKMKVRTATELAALVRD